MYAVKLRNQPDWYNFDYCNLLLFLNNDKVLLYVHDFLDYHVSCITIQEIRNSVGYRHVVNRQQTLLYCMYYGDRLRAPSISTLSDKQVANILNEAQSLAIDLESDYQRSYAASHNLLGNQIKPFLSDLSEPLNKKVAPHRRSHSVMPFRTSNNCHYQSNSHRRAAKIFNTVIQSKLNQDIDNASYLLRANLFRHHNRHLDDNSYVWDDTEQMRARRSTGWKSHKSQKRQWDRL